MSTLKVNAIRSTSDVEMFLAKAWVNFNGTGTVAIRASGNVTSITDVGVGTYTINFTAAMPDTNYATVTAFGGSGSADWGGGLDSARTVSTTSAPIYSAYSTNAKADCDQINVAIFR